MATRSGWKIILKIGVRIKVDDAKELLGQAIDRVDNLAHGLEIPMSGEFHVKQLKVLLPEVVRELKKGFVAVTGENPWEGQPE